MRRCIELDRQRGLEPRPYSLEGCCSVLLSHWRKKARKSSGLIVLYRMSKASRRITEFKLILAHFARSETGNLHGIYRTSQGKAWLQRMITR